MSANKERSTQQADREKLKPKERAHCRGSMTDWVLTAREEFLREVWRPKEKLHRAPREVRRAGRHKPTPADSPAKAFRPSSLMQINARCSDVRYNRAWPRRNISPAHMHP